MSNSRLPYLFAAVSAVCMALAWYVPGTPACALLGWASVIMMVSCVRLTRTPYRAMLLYGCIANAGGFYWLFTTIKDFGGMPWYAAAAVFLLFVVLSSNQQLIFLFIYRRFSEKFHDSCLGCAIAWPVSEFIAVRIFPWSIGHTQLAFREYVQVADLFGTTGIVVLMLWLTESLIALFHERDFKVPHLVPIVLNVVSVIYGFTQVASYSKPHGQQLAVALVQGNVSLAEKHNTKYFTINTKRYQELSEKVARPGLLVVWPESVITSFVRDDIQNVIEDKHLPFLSSQSGMLIGALTYRTENEYYNSAIAISPDGSVSPPYHKQILMPFGEYTPFVNTFPWLKALNQTAGEFSAGKSVSVFQYDVPGEFSWPLRFSPLICYEDVIPSLARDAVGAGAELLINLTNDAWFGNTVAPRQHHLIAAFRAIENRRYLLRATNSGLTAIVDPTGATTAELPVFSEGVLTERVEAISDPTFYSYRVGPAFNIALLTLAIILCIGSLVRKLRDHLGF